MSQKKYPTDDIGCVFSLMLLPLFLLLGMGPTPSEKGCAISGCGLLLVLIFLIIMVVSGMKPF